MRTGLLARGLAWPSHRPRTRTPHRGGCARPRTGASLSKTPFASLGSVVPSAFHRVVQRSPLRHHRLRSPLPPTGWWASALRCQAPRAFRPRGSSPPRRLAPPKVSRACCIPQATMGFTGLRPCQTTCRWPSRGVPAGASPSRAHPLEKQTPRHRRSMPPRRCRTAARPTSRPCSSREAATSPHRCRHARRHVALMGFPLLKPCACRSPQRAPKNPPPPEPVRASSRARGPLLPREWLRAPTPVPARDAPPTESEARAAGACRRLFAVPEGSASGSGLVARTTHLIRFTRAGRPPVEALRGTRPRGS